MININTKIVVILIAVSVISTELLMAAPVGKFFLQHRMGPLVRVDPASAYKARYPQKKGPRPHEVSALLSSDEFDYINRRLVELKMASDIGDLKQYYIQDVTGDWVLKISLDDAEKIQKIREMCEARKIFLTDYVTLKNYSYSTILKKVSDSDALFIRENYSQSDDGKRWNLAVDMAELTQLEVLRQKFLRVYQDNEIPMDFVENYGTPLPHNFPRVHFAKSKAYVDIHLAWGVRIEDPAVPGNFTVGFALNIQNFTMFSLELITFKYNFEVPYIDSVEPYLGFALYGGYADGFPIGLDLIGGIDIYPIDDFVTGGYENHNFFVSAEMRLGPVLYIPRYYDTGINSETIYKKAVVLIENGYYFGIGYIFN